MIGTLISILIVALIVVVAFYLIDLIPLPGNAKTIVKIIIGVIVLVWLLGVFLGAPLYFYRGG